MKCTLFGHRLVVLQIPLLSDQCERDVLPGNNSVIAEYNQAIDEFSAECGVESLDPFANNEDPTRNSLYLKDSVHFSEKGHRLVAENLVRFLSRERALEAPR